MAWCKTDISDFFRWIFFSFKSAWIFACAFQLRSKTLPCISLWLVCTLFLRKTKTKYRSVHNECNKVEKEHFSQKNIQENVFLLNWKAHAKIQALLKEKISPEKVTYISLAPSHSIIIIIIVIIIVIVIIIIIMIILIIKTQISDGIKRCLSTHSKWKRAPWFAT